MERTFYGQQTGQQSYEKHDTMFLGFFSYRVYQEEESLKWNCRGPWANCHQCKEGLNSVSIFNFVRASGLFAILHTHEMICTAFSSNLFPICYHSCLEQLLWLFSYRNFRLCYRKQISPDQLTIFGWL